ncbi:proteoglycan 4-like isoform X2 [Mercenaria mercenaria]|nr:proteoglycan 4-like isoform X2 [Mercenaria mercenaria]
MKEQTYGWYPSAKNVYEDRRIDTLTPYQLEALYRYRESKYYQPAVTPPEERTSRGKSRSTSSRAGSKAASRQSDNEAHLNLQPRVQSAPIYTTYKPPPRLNLPTPQQCWSTHVPETEITVLPPPSVSATMPRETTQRSSAYAQSVQVQSPTTAVSPSNVQKIARIQSATVRRETPAKPQRPVKSAGPIRPSPSPVRQIPTPQSQSYTPQPLQTNYFECSWPQPTSAINIDDIPAPTSVQIYERPPSGRISVSRTAPSPAEPKRATPTQRKLQSPSNRPPSGKRTPLRPMAPSPYKMDLHLEEDEYLGRSETPDYDEEVKRHGWMMEVHGDPLKIKKVSRRLPYTVKVDEPETERDPPKVHMENNETFFLNTIPKRPFTFAIDKEWISETIHKKRMEMQKKHGLNYRFKNFSFVY